MSNPKNEKSSQNKGGSSSANLARMAALIGGGVGALALLIMIVSVHSTVSHAAERLAKPDAPAITPDTKVAVADDTEAPYCTPAFKTVLQRVLNACGLVGGEARRGCQPADVKTFASISDDDFNALFTPLKDRGAVVLFDEGKDDLDANGQKLLEDKWLDRKGARYFFVVARASKTGSADYNRALSHKRANSVLFFLKDQTKDPDLDKLVGLLWLGNEFAQLDKSYCDWPSSRPAPASAGAAAGGGGACNPEAVNRSAFVSWVDCRL